MKTSPDTRNVELLDSILADATFNEYFISKDKPIRQASVCFLMDGMEKMIATHATGQGEKTRDEHRRGLREKLEGLIDSSHSIARHPGYGKIK